MYDSDTLDEPDEPDWFPPPPPPDPWNRWESRVGQVIVLQVVAVGIPVVLAWIGLSRPGATKWLLCAVGPALLCAWLGVLAYFRTRASESDGTRSERGRMLVLMLDVLAAIFTVVGLCLWIAILTS